MGKSRTLYKEFMDKYLVRSFRYMSGQDGLNGVE